MPRIADVLKTLKKGTLRGLARPRGCRVEGLSTSLQGDWVALVSSLSARQIADALYNVMDETDLRILAVRAFQQSDTPIEFVASQDGWSQPLKVRSLMCGIAGWNNAAPGALLDGTWQTVVTKLRGLGLEVQDPGNPDQGIRRGRANNNPGIAGSVRIRRLFNPRD